MLVLWLGGREVLHGRIDVGGFVAFNTYMVQLTWPVIALGWVINIFQRGTASMGRINESDAGKGGDHRCAGRRSPTPASEFGERSSSAI